MNKWTSLKANTESIEAPAHGAFIVEQETSGAVVSPSTDRGFERAVA